MESLETNLKNLGFYTLQQRRSEVLDLVARNAAHAGSTAKNSPFEALISYLPAKSADDTRETQLIIDIGGTSTKAGLCFIEDNARQWKILFEKENGEFKPETLRDAPLLTYAQALASTTATALKETQFSTTAVRHCALVWSNAMRNEKLNAPCGVTGIIEQVEYYNKGEWFIADLQNGTDLGRVFLDALRAEGLSIDSFLIANDTPLTMKALPGAHGGIVASTGLNGTLVKTLAELSNTNSDSTELIICNAEMGGRFLLDREFLSSADTIDGTYADCAELLSAGRFLPDIFISHVAALSDAYPNLKGIAQQLTAQRLSPEHRFRAKDMGLLLSDQNVFLSRQQKPELYTVECLEVLTSLSAELFKRAAYICAIVAYGTVSNRIDVLEHPLIAVDSRLAREVPLFRESFFESLTSIADYLGTQLEARIIEPLITTDGKISVPMQGASQSLFSFSSQCKSL